MYCTKCGLEIVDDAQFCGFCGEPIDHLTNHQVQPTQPTQPIPFQTSSTPPKSSKPTGKIIGTLCIVLIVGIVLIFFGSQIRDTIPSTGITILVVGAIVILCVGCSVCGSGRRRGGYVGGGGCSGCGDCGGCDCGDCDCGGCDCGGCDC